MHRLLVFKRNSVGNKTQTHPQVLYRTSTLRWVGYKDGIHKLILLTFVFWKVQVFIIL